MKMSDQNKLAMDRHVAFYKRQLNEEIMVCFVGKIGSDEAEQPEEVEYSSIGIDENQMLSEENPRIFENLPKMLKDFENGIRGQA